MEGWRLWGGEGDGLGKAGWLEGDGESVVEMLLLGLAREVALHAISLRR